MVEATLPTEEEIAQLPRWAKVAFAARCARRVLPLFTQDWEYAPKRCVEALNKAVEAAEQSAAAADVGYATAANAADANLARISSAADANRAPRNDPTPNPYGGSSKGGQSAGIVLYAALNAFDAVRATPYYAAIYTCAAAAMAARANRRMIPVIRADFQRVLAESRRQKWSKDTPVPPTVFDHLDVSPIPPADPLDSDEHIAFSLQAFAEPVASAFTLAEHLLAMYKALNEYTLAKYGKHLSRGHFRKLVYKHAGVPV